jgi:TonB family protein
MKKFRILVLAAAYAAVILFNAELKATDPGADSVIKNTNPTDSTHMPSIDSFIQVDVEPVMIFVSSPEYPAKALDSSIEAQVKIIAFIDTAGIVKKVQTTECLKFGWGFEKAAKKAAYKCRYKPAQKNGKPLGVWVTYWMKFEMEHDKKVKE